MCKRIFVIMLMLVVLGVMQADAQQLNYQAIARNANGVALTFRDVGIRLSIRDGSPNGSIVYSESRNIRTNQFGLFTVIIGSPGATSVLGSMASINWISGNKYLQVEIDPEGGTNYFQAGTSQLQAVPYALFANAAYPVGPAGGDLLGSTYPNPIIAPLAVTTGKIANQAITTPKIADLNVTTPKLADQAVTNAKIQDNTIANIKLVNSRVTLNGLILNLGDTQDFALGTNGIDVNIVSAGNTHTFNFPDASIANRGLITPNAQTIGGNKTFNNDITAARIIRAGGLAAQFLKADGSVDNNIYLTENQPIIVTATGDATGVSTSSRTAPVLPLTLATVNSAVGTYGTNIVVPSITVNNKGLVTNVVANPIPTATAITSGLLTVGDWNIFNNKQNAIPLGSAAQYFRGDLTLSNFETDVRNQLSAGTNITYANGNIGLTNNSVTLNSLPLTLGGAQTFATGTTGVDFNISSAGSVHTFNIPNASVFARGLISSTDYTNFNAAYNNRIASLTTTGTSGAATLSGNVLNIPNYTYTLPAATATTLGGIIPGANITNTSGTISITGNNVIDALGSQVSNRFLVAPNGANGLPSFRAMATGDIPDNIVTNIKLANSSINLGSTNIPLGTTANTLLGLTSITSGAFVGPLTGNASTASTWANQRTLSLTGDVTYTSNPFDGSANTTGVATLANSGVTAGTYGASNTIPTITVDAKGRLTSVSTNLISGVSNLGSSLNSGNIIVGSAANIAAQVPMSGDVTITPAGVTSIGALKVTDAMLAPGITDGKLATISAIGKVANSATTATNLNNINTIVLRDAAGDFSAGNITANLTGNVTGNITGTSANVTGIVLGANGGTGVANTGRTITLGGNVVTAGDLTTAGAFATTLISTGATNVTLPTTGTLATLAGIETLTNKSIAAGSNTITGLTNANLSGTAGITDANLATISTAGKVSNSATTATSANTLNTIVLRDAAGDFSAGNITANLTGNVTGNITGTSANVTGIVLGANGGTGVANTGRTITLGGNVLTAGDLTTAGAFATTLTSTAATNVTLPTTGTLATLAGTETLTNKSIAAGSNTITGLTNANLSGTAGITDANLATISTAGKVSNSATTATSANTINTIVLRDAAGDFSAGTITANLTGNVTGNITGTSANVTGIVLGANGGTGVANTGRTMTLGGNILTAGDLTTAGAFATTLNSTAATNVTLPTTGTLATLAGTEIFTNKTLTSPVINNPTISFTNNGLVAANADAQGSATVNTDLNIITTAASTPSGITLPSATIGRRIVIVNRGANAVKVYPATGEQIDALGNNSAYSSIPVNGYLELFATSTTQWYTSSNATSSTQWNVVGNNSLDATLNFLGTTDNSPLRFRVNGSWAGELNPSKSTNVSFGIGAMNNSFAGTNNTAFGSSSLTAVGNGVGNTGLGFETLKAVTTSSLSTAVGAGALTKNDGAQNTAVGAAALSQNTTGTDNTAVGQAALLNSTGTNNTALGQNSLATGTSFSNNTGVGQASLFSTIGNNNTAIGRGSLENANAGVDNTAIGYLAGRNFGELFVLGDVATNITRSVMIGSNTRTSTNTSDNEIVIGYDAVGNGSNTVQLGNTSITTVKTAGVINAAGTIFSLAAKNSDYTVTDSDYYIKVTASAIITLPSAANRLGRKFVIFNHHSGSNTVNSASNIVGFGNTTNSISVFTMRSLIVISDGANWLIESNSF